MKRHWILGAFVATAVISGCMDRQYNKESNTSDLPYSRNNPKWIYNGPLPKLDNPYMVISQNGHTARVWGYLPASFTGKVPYWALETAENGRRRIDVAYPVATHTDPNRNAEAGTYPDVLIIPWLPNDSHAEWGGFPYIEYNHARGIALHCPITHEGENGSWRLKRGRVSHGCNRMQGEHVVEMAHMLGVDMSKPHASGSVTLTLPVKVQKEYDTYQGKTVDVDFPAGPGMTRPTENVIKFPTWDARDFARLVCEYKANPGNCSYKPANRKDMYSGSAGGSVLLPGQNAEICKGTNINVRDDNMAVTDQTDEGDPLKRDPVGQRQTKQQTISNKVYTFERVHFLSVPEGPGWVSQEYICDLPGSGTPPPRIGAIECPQGYHLEKVGEGQFCTDGTNGWGPFTEAMIQKCLQWTGGGAENEKICRGDRWAKDMVVNARGTGVCPVGANLDAGTGYCVEGQNAFGPFPKALIAKCEAADGGSACKSARWSVNFLRSLLP